jgi:hypothetical protein
MRSWAYLLDGQHNKALIDAEEAKLWGEDAGCEIIARPACSLFGLALIAARRDMNKGMKILKACHSDWLNNGGRYFSVTLDFMMGNIHLNIVQPSEPIARSSIRKNLRFLIKNAPFASLKAEKYIRKTIKVTREVGAFGVTGHAYLCLGILYQRKKNIRKAKECLTEAIKIFEQNGAEENLKQAKEALATIG